MVLSRGKMDPRKISFVFLMFAVLISVTSAIAQESVFSDPNVDYRFTLPNDTWKMTTKPSELSPNVEYVYGLRRDGFLEVRRMVVSKDTLLTDLIRNEEPKLQFLPGYVAGSEENFRGKFSGSIFNYEYAHSGHAFGGRMYFLRANDTTVYVLKFTGNKESLRSIRNQTDSIARTFTTSK